MNSTLFARTLGACLAITSVILPSVGQARPLLHAHKTLQRTAVKSIKRGKPVSKQERSHTVPSAIRLSPLEKMALRHAARREASARKTARFEANQEHDGEEEREREAGSRGAISGGDDYMWWIRSYPNNFIDPGAFDRAVKQRARLPRANIGNAGSKKRQPRALLPTATWAFVGPTNWYPTAQRAYYGFESMNGHVSSIAPDPANRLILYVASKTGGVFKTTDGGVTWNPMSNNWLYLRTNVVAVDPKNSSIVYAGTGTSPTGSGNAIGLMKTTDGGSTWNNIGAVSAPNGFAGLNISRLLIDPSDSNRITVTNGDIQIGSRIIHSAFQNIWNSTDGGMSWTKKIPPFVAPEGGAYTDGGTWDDAMITKGGSYFAVGKGPSGTVYNDLLYRSTDQGQTWAQLANAPKPPADTTQTQGARLAASAVDAKTLYLVYTFYDSNTKVGKHTLFKSVDNGDTWTDISASSGINVPPSAGTVSAPVQELDQVPYDYYLACSMRSVNGTATDVLYLGLKSVFQQVQVPGTSVWTNVGNAYSDTANMHSDQQCIAFDPANPDRGWFGNDGGIYQFFSSPTTGMTNFLSLNDGLQTTQFYPGVAYHPTNPDIMTGGTQDNGTAAALGDLNSWQMVRGGDGAYTLINPLNPQIMYNTYVQGPISRTNDMYETPAASITPDLTAAGVGSVSFVTPLAMDMTNPNFIYTAGQKLGRYDANSGGWSYFPTLLPKDNNGKVTTIAVSPISGMRIYVSTDDGKLLTTGDGGANWVTLKAGVMTDTLPDRNVGSILPDPASSTGVYVGLSGVGTDHLYYCADVTAAVPVWTSLNGAQAATALPDSPLNTIAIDPADANIVFVGTDIGVFQTPDRGMTWSNATAPLGLPNVQVNDLKAMPMQGYLYAATWGRGIYRIRLRNSDPVAGLLVAPERVVGGQTIVGTVLLGAAAAVDTTVVLTSSAPRVAMTSRSIVIPAGQSQGTFNIATMPVSFTATAQITASVAGVGPQFSKSHPVTVLTGTVLPSLQSFVFDGFGTGLGYGISGSTALNGVVTLTKPAPADIPVAITSSSAGATVPATVIVPAGQKSVTFSIQLNAVSAPEETRITAQLGSFRRTITASRK